MAEKLLTWIFDATTRSTARKSFNKLAQGAIVSLTFVGLIAINFVVSLVVNWMLQFVTKAFNIGVGQQTIQLLSYIPLGYFVVASFAMLIASIFDLWNVVRISVGSSGDVEDDDASRVDK